MLTCDNLRVSSFLNIFSVFYPRALAMLECTVLCCVHGGLRRLCMR